MTLSGPALVLDPSDDPTAYEQLLLDMAAGLGAEGSPITIGAGARALLRRVPEARYVRLVAHLDGLAAQATGPAAIAMVAALRSVAARHFPWKVYSECDCDPGHQDVDEPGVIDVDEIGLVCEEGFLYSICAECCTVESSWDKSQREDCANDHEHVNTRPLCQTLTGIEGALGLGEPE